jgi:hypothetical protein
MIGFLAGFVTGVVGTLAYAWVDYLFWQKQRRKRFGKGT